MAFATFEPQQLVRSFSEEAEWRLDRGNNHHELVDALQENTRRERTSVLEETEQWERLFKPRKPSSDSEIAKIDIESNKLREAIRTFHHALPAEDREGLVLRAGNFDAIVGLVQKIESKWEKKSNTGAFGKTKNYLRRTCATMNSHKMMLKILPEASEYVSVFSGSLQVLLAATSNYESVAHGLSKSLCIIGEHVEACLRDCTLYPTLSIQQRIVDLYSHVFLFLTDAIGWYTQKSHRRLLSSLKEDFYAHFESQIENIKRLSDVIHREALSGMGGEVRVTRQHVEAIHKDIQDLRVGLQGIERREAELRYREEEFLRSKEREAADSQQLQLNALSRLGTAAKHLLGDLAVNQLVEQALHMNSNLRERRRELEGTEDVARSLAIDTSHLSISAGKTESNFPATTLRDDVALHSKQMETYFDRSQLLTHMTRSEEVYIGQRVVSLVQEWMSDPKAPALYLAGPIQHTQDALSTALATKVVSSVVKSEIPVISYSCKLRRSRRSSDSREAEELIALAFALIRQLVELLLPEVDTPTDLSLSRFAKLDGSFSGWASAMSLLRDLLELAPPLLICVVDGLQTLDDVSTNNALVELIDTLRGGQCVQLGSEACRRKTFFTTAGRSRALLKALPTREMIFTDDQTAARSPGLQSPGRTNFFVSAG